MWKKVIALVLSASLLVPSVVMAEGVNDIKAVSAILMDGSSGKVLFEKNADQRLPPASITKIMTMLLIMEAIDSGQISTDDIVTVSKTAAIKTGSHIFLAEGEQMSVNDLMKGIAVASGNDAAIAMAEYLYGTQEKFVEQMNKRAKELGMENTNFVNCNGLDVDNHYSSARDVALMTLELLKHPKIFDYTTIWMDTLRNGQFGLANTNKLIRFYEGANGMKTGSTSKAGYCLSATAKRGDMQLIAVVMSSPSTKERFADGSTLLNYGFGSFTREVKATAGEAYGELAVEGGVKSAAPLAYGDDFSIVVENGNKNSITAEPNLPESIQAPVTKGQKVGEMVYYEQGKQVGKSDLVASEDVEKISFLYVLSKLVGQYFQI